MDGFPIENFILILKQYDVDLSIRDLNYFIFTLDTFWIDHRIKLADFIRSMNKAVEPYSARKINRTKLEATNS